MELVIHIMVHFVITEAEPNADCCFV